MRHALRVVLLLAFAAGALVVLRERPGTTVIQPAAEPVVQPAPEPVVEGAGAPATVLGTTTSVVRRGMPLADAIAASVPPRFDRKPAPAFGGCEAKGQRSPAEFADAIARSSWPRDQWDKVCRVVACESMWRADAQRTSSRSTRAGRVVVRYLGYFQIEDRSWSAQYASMGYDDAAMLTALPNLQVGYWLWSTVGESRWSTAQWDCAGA